MRRLLYTLCAVLCASCLYAQLRDVPPSIPLDECKHRLMQSYDKEAYDSFVKYGETQQNMYYYIYVATNFSYSTTLLHYPANDVASIYHHRLQQMDTLSTRVYFEILQEGSKHNESWCIKDLAQFYGMVHQDTLTALDYYQRYLQLDVPSEKHQRSIEVFLEYLINPALSDRGKVVQYPNTALPDTPEDWRYRIIWSGDISAYNQLMSWARQSNNICDFCECLYYSLVMAGKYAYLPAHADLREIFGTMITDSTPEEALARRLLQLL